MEQSAMEEILKFGEFSSMLNKTQSFANKTGRKRGEDPDYDEQGDEMESAMMSNIDNESTRDNGQCHE